ncbi:MAG: Ig-like domain-containing protein [Gemmatimonadota bacterium]|nr:Ig-like domain-containing protein [Gemmatimonadota bacterium]MDE2871158.1 Ig-like domain-containing protein [Gemmatimonadota bacterium]
MSWNPCRSSVVAVVVAAPAACLWGACAEPPVPATVRILPVSATLRSLGDTVRLTAAVQDQNGRAIADASIMWSSRDTSVATVNAAGLVTAARNGRAAVTASAGAASAAASVTVAQEVDAILVVPEAFKLIRRGSVRASAEAWDANGHPMPGVSFAWSTTDSTVAGVESGLISAAGVGIASVTASAGEVESASGISVVVPPPVRSVEMPSVPTNGGIRSGGGSWELPLDEVFTAVLVGTGNPGYDFVRWSEGGATLSTDSVYEMQLAGDHEIAAHFSVNPERGRWGPANTYSDYRFPDTAYESLAWTFLPAVDPPESLREKDLLHYYAYQFHLLNSTTEVGRGYAGFQSDGHLRTDDGDRWGKVVNFAVWGSDSARTDGLVNPENEECGCYQIMFQYEWVGEREYRFELKEGPGGEVDEGKWWGLWVTDRVTDSTTFVGEQRVPAEIGGRPSVLWKPYTAAFGEDMHWWHSRDGAKKYICSDFEGSSLAILDVTAGEGKDEDRPTRVGSWTNGGHVDVAENGYETTLCHVTVFQDGSGNVQHNVGYWPEPPENVLPEEDNRPVRR